MSLGLDSDKVSRIGQTNCVQIKLELVVGIYAQDMKLELRSAQGKFLAELFGDDKTLEELGVTNQSVVHVIDTTGNSPLSDGINGDSSQARYVMNDDKYANRKGKQI